VAQKYSWHDPSRRPFVAIKKLIQLHCPPPATLAFTRCAEGAAQKNMKIYSSLHRVVLLCIVLLSGRQADAALITSFDSIYAAFAYQGPSSLKFVFGVNSGTYFNLDGSWDASLLTIDDFSDSQWGAVFSLNDSNSPEFGSFVAKIQDSEASYIGDTIFRNNGSVGSAFIEPQQVFSSVNLSKYDIAEIQIRFFETHLFDGPVTQTQGTYRVSVFGDLASVPDMGSSLGLLAGTLLMLAAVGSRSKR
jgi:hypothetical protein